MAGGTWKIAVFVAVMVVFALLEFHTAEAQVVNGCSQCAARARCHYSYSTGYYCSCRRGYSGYPYIGSSNSGCRKRHLRVWKVVISIIGAIIGALLLLCLCLACLRNCLMRRRRSHGPVVQQGDPAHGYAQQAAYPQQGVPMYETNQQKVPEPAGVV